jgi:hypothetical protein
LSDSVDLHHFAGQTGSFDSIDLRFVLAESVVFALGAYVLVERLSVLESIRQGDLGRRHEDLGWEVWEYLRAGVMDRVDVGDEGTLLGRVDGIDQGSAEMKDVREVERVHEFEGVIVVEKIVGFVGTVRSVSVGIVGFVIVERIEFECLGRVDFDYEVGRVGSRFVAEADDLCSVV